MRLSVAWLVGVDLFIKMSSMKWINMDEALKGTVFSVNHRRNALDVVQIVVDHL